MNTARTLAHTRLLLALSFLASCGAEWRPIRALPPEPLPARAEPHSEPHTEPELLHGHRDFPATFDRVWDATIQTLHASGIAVPLEMREAEHEGRIDVEACLVEVEERAPGRVCVFVRFRGLPRSRGEERARAWLDEVGRRLSL